MGRFDGGAQMGEQGFDFAPMNVGTRGVVINVLQQMQMFVAHGNLLFALGFGGLKSKWSHH